MMNEIEAAMSIWEKLDSLKFSQENPETQCGFPDLLELEFHFPPDFEVMSLLEQAFQENPEKLLELLERKEDSIMRHCLFLMCSPDMLMSFTRDIKSANADTLYECCWQLLRLPSEKGIGVEGALAAALPRLADMDPGLWCLWLKTHEWEPKWLALLPHILGKLSESALASYTDMVSLDRQPQNQELEKITAALQALPDEAHEYVIHMIAPRIYERWEILLDDWKKQRRFRSSLCVTAYANLICASLCHVLGTEEARRQELARWRCTLEHDMEQWFESPAHASVYYFTDLTQIYLLLAIQQHGLSAADDTFRETLYDILQLIKQYDFLWGSQDDPFKIELENILTKEALL